VTPVLRMGEAVAHPQAQARDAFIEVGGVVQPAPAPRLQRTPGAVQSVPPLPGEHSEQILRAHGFGDAEIAQAIAAGIVHEG
jgi:alpha-methylacyl-CoA racemase